VRDQEAVKGITRPIELQSLREPSAARRLVQPPAVIRANPLRARCEHARSEDAPFVRPAALGPDPSELTLDSARVHRDCLEFAPRASVVKESRPHLVATRSGEVVEVLEIR